MEIAEDSYTVILSSLLTKTEDLLGLNKTHEQSTLALRDKDIETVLSEVIRKAQSLHKAENHEELKSLNTELSKQLAPLSYTGQRMSYYKKVRLDFHLFPKVNEIAQVLAPFTKEDFVAEEALRNLNRLVEILKLVEQKQVNVRFSLAYRFVRLFILVTLVNQGSYFMSNLIATFVLQQLARG